MASMILPPNGQQHCEACGQKPGPTLRVLYDPDLRKHLCPWCWFATPPSEIALPPSR